MIGYLKKVPTLGILMKFARGSSCFGFPGKGLLNGDSHLVVESITDADWAGCRRTRRSRTSIQIWIGGSLAVTFVRSQRAMAMSSGESEFIAMVGGSAEALYIGECLKFLVEGSGILIEVRSRTDSAACRGIAQRIGCGRIRHIDTALLWLQSAVKAKRVAVGIVPGFCNPADLGTKPLAGPRMKELLYLMNAKDVDFEDYGKTEYEQAAAKRNLAQVLKDYKTQSGGARVNNIKVMMPLLIMMCQVMQGEGLSFSLPAAAAVLNEESFSMIIFTLGFGCLVALLVFGLPWAISTCLSWAAKKVFGQGAATGGNQTPRAPATPTTHDAGVQASRGMSKEENKFVQEYVNRATDLREVLSERCAEIREFETEVVRLRDHIRGLENELTRARARRAVPERIAVAPTRGERFHLPGCGNVRNTVTREYTPCQACLGRMG